MRVGSRLHALLAVVLAALVVALAAPSAPPAAATAAATDDHAVDTVRQLLADAHARAGAAPRAHTASVYAVVRDGDTITVVRGDTKATEARSVRRALAAIDGVVVTGVDHAVSAFDTSAESTPTNDPLWSQQWALTAVDYQSAWATSDGATARVAVVDTGVRGDHEDLAGSLDAGADCVSASSAAQCVSVAANAWTDPNGHGTHVSGILAAHANNALGIAGAAPGVRVVPVRVLDSTGSGTSSSVSAGIIWAADHDVDVISMSLGGDADPGMAAAVAYAIDHGVVVVASSGNNYFVTGTTTVDNAQRYPASYPGVLSVGALKNSSGTYTRALYSNTSSNVGLMAPGSSILSTLPGTTSSYGSMSGTSMATPYVSAAAAMVHATQPAWTPAQVVSRLESTATPMADSTGIGSPTGFGIVNPVAALAGMTPVSTTTTSTTTSTTSTSTSTTTTTIATTTTTVNGPAPTTTTVPPPKPESKPKPPPRRVRGYWVAYRDGRVRGFGIRTLGDRYRRTRAPIVALGATPSGRGYWLAGADGSMSAFGDARLHGSFAGRHLNKPIVAMAPTRTGRGYWLLASDGGIFSFGDARFYGSTGNIRLKSPVVDLAPTPTGHGYWLVAADGGIFSFGDARFRGSTGSMRLAASVASMAAPATKPGYFLIARDGGVFCFGPPFAGSMRALGNRGNVVRMRATPSGSGYWILTANGDVHAFGAARSFGSSAHPGAVDFALAIS